MEVERERWKGRGREGDVGRERQGGRTNDVLFLDLADGGAEHFAQTVREIKQR